MCVVKSGRAGYLRKRAERFARFTWSNFAKAAQFPFPVSLAGGGFRARYIAAGSAGEKGFASTIAPYRAGEEIQNTVRFGARSAYCGTNSYLDNKGEPTLFIIDDCSATKALTKKRDMLSKLAFSGHHADKSVWVLTQKYNCPDGLARADALGRTLPMQGSRQL